MTEPSTELGAPDFTVASLARLAVAVVLHDRDALRTFARTHADDAGHSVRVLETLRQCHVFCGFPRSLAAMDVLRDAGLRFTIPEDDSPDPSEPEARGAVLFDSIYAAKADAIREHIVDLDPAFARWIAEHAYGRVLTRPGLEAHERELLAVAKLAALGHDRQLASHARGAVRCGATPASVIAILDAAKDIVPSDRTVRAHAVVDRFAAEPPQ